MTTQFQPTIALETRRQILTNGHTWRIGQWIKLGVNKGQFIGVDRRGRIHVCWLVKGEDRIAHSKRFSALVDAYKAIQRQPKPKFSRYLIAAMVAIAILTLATVTFIQSTPRQDALAVEHIGNATLVTQGDKTICATSRDQTARLTLMRAAIKRALTHK